MSAPAAARPFALPVLGDGILPELAARDRWLAWRWSWDAGRGAWTKPPSCARTGRRVGATDPSAWAPFAVAWAAYGAGGWDGLGLALIPGDPLAGVDLDGCRDPRTGALAPWAATLVRRFGSYAEASPSGTGVRVWLRGSLAGLLPGGRLGVRCGPVEAYSGGRYLTATGHKLADAPALVADGQAALAALVADLVQVPPPPAPPGPAAPEPPPLADGALLARARAARNGAKLAALFDRGDTGPYGGDDSAADLALCALLVFWTRDPAQLDRLFRRSALYRAKWERPDYRDRTVARALERRDAFDPAPGSPPVRPMRAVPPARGRRHVVDLSPGEDRRGR